MRCKSPAQADKILTAAARLFATHRFHEARMEDIAALAEVAKGTIYRYFRDKDELYLALLRLAGDALQERLVPCHDAHARPPPPARPARRRDHHLFRRAAAPLRPHHPRRGHAAARRRVPLAGDPLPDVRPHPRHLPRRRRRGPLPHRRPRTRHALAPGRHPRRPPLPAAATPRGHRRPHRRGLPGGPPAEAGTVRGRRPLLAFRATVIDAAASPAHNS